MTSHESPNPQPVRLASRRNFLCVAGGTVLGTVGALTVPGFIDGRSGDSSASGNFGPAPGARTFVSGGVDPGYILVSIQLEGGLDFLNTVVPVDDRRYREVRGDGALSEGRNGEEDGAVLERLDDTYVMNSMPHLASRWGAGDLAIVHGVGWEGSSLSHFDATDMWEKGSPDFGTSTGWLGRPMADLAGDEADALLAISMGGVSASMYADGWSPVGLHPEARIPWSAEFRDEYGALDRALGGLTPDGGSGLAARARDSQLELRGIGARLGPIVGEREEVDDADEDDDSGYLGVQLDVVADLINGGIPTRAFHVQHGGFDTHGNQAYDLPWLLTELDSSIRRFQSRLGPAADRVIIATWSEFGRRPEWNGEGTEHGTAGIGFVTGPAVIGGHFGEPSPLDRFDADGNFIVTTDFRDYLSGLTLGAFGVDPGRVVDGGRGPLALIKEA